MKQSIFASLLVALSMTCHAADLKDPLTITFYKNSKDSNQWADATEYEDPNNVDRGTSVHDKDERYLNHYKYTKTEEEPRVFFWKNIINELRTCRVLVDADPMIDDLIYHLDNKTFEYPDGSKPSLSGVHIRCDDHVDEIVDYDEATGNSFPVYQKAELGDADFELPLLVQFHISDDEITDFKWTDTTVGKPSDQEMAREKITPENPAIELYGRDSVYVPINPEGKMVGTFWFFRYRTEARKFTWKLHEGDNERTCYFNAAFDPHMARVAVNMDKDQPTIDTHMGWGDPDALTVYCEDVKE